MDLAPDDHEQRARQLLATIQNVPTAEDAAVEATRESRDLGRYQRLLDRALTHHGERYASAAVPTCLAPPLTRHYVADRGYSVRRAPARTPSHVVLTLYRAAEAPTC